MEGRKGYRLNIIIDRHKIRKYEIGLNVIKYSKAKYIFKIILQ